MKMVFDVGLPEIIKAISVIKVVARANQVCQPYRRVFSFSFMRIAHLNVSEFFPSWSLFCFVGDVGKKTQTEGTQSKDWERTKFLRTGKNCNGKKRKKTWESTPNFC